MATIISHALIAGSLFSISPISPKKKTLVLCLLGSILPDFDVIGFKFGIQYQDMLGHRGFTHSILFSFIYAILCLLLYRNTQKLMKFKLFSLFFLSIFAHAIFDMLTNGGLGVGLLIPFSSERFFFPIRPLEVSPIGVNFFSARGLDVIYNEFIYIFIPSICIFILAYIKKKIVLKRN